MILNRRSDTKLLDTAPNPGSKLFEVNNWAISEMIIDKIVPTVGVHPFPLNELQLMAGAVARLQPQLIFEWGTHIGKSARVFYEISSALSLPTTIHSIDLPDDIEHNEHPHEGRGILVKGIKAVKLHQGDGLDTALSIMAKSKKNKSGERVLFFIDGDHSYESVKRELSGVIKAAPNAWIILHDTFNQSADAKYNTGPHRAVNDCLKVTKKKYERVETSTGLPGMTLLVPS